MTGEGQQLKDLEEYLNRTVAEAMPRLPAALQHAVARLTERQRRAFLLVHHVGMTETQAAWTLGVKRSVVSRAVAAASRERWSNDIDPRTIPDKVFWSEVGRRVRGRLAERAA